MLYPKVTIIVVPHECFSHTQESLESIYKHTNIPFKLIYVDGYSPEKVKQYLEIQSQEKGFRLIRTDKYVSPNKARNIGLKHVDTEYVVFINNDVLVTDGWLNNLMLCAEKTNASVVSPVCLQGTSEQQVVHFAGGTLEFHYKYRDLDLFDKRLFTNQSLHQVKSQLVAQPTQIIDFSCVLVRTPIFEHIGSLDEKLLSVTEEIDFCLSVFSVGGTIYLEPESIVNYLQITELKISDIPYYFLRYNYVWNRKSINHFQEKWELGKDGHFITNLVERVNKPKILPLEELNKCMKNLYLKEDSYPLHGNQKSKVKSQNSKLLKSY